MAETITAAELAELERLVSEATSGLMASSEHFYQRVRARHAVIEALPNLIAAYRAQGVEIARLNGEAVNCIRTHGLAAKRIAVAEATRDAATARADLAEAALREIVKWDDAYEVLPVSLESLARAALDSASRQEVGA